MRACCSLKTRDVQQRHKNNNNGTQLFVCRCRWEERPPSISQTRRAMIPFPTLCYRPRCRKSPPTVLLSRCVLSRSSISRLLVRFSAHRVCPLPSPCAITVTSTAQIVLAAMHADSGRRQGQAPGAHYPHACAARHRLLFAASRTLRAVSRGETRRQPLRTEL